MTPSRTVTSAALAAILTGIATIATAFTTLNGSPQATGIASGAAAVAAAVWKLLDSHDKRLAADAVSARDALTQRLPELASAIAELRRTAATIPAVETRVTAIDTSLGELAAHISAGTGLDVAALADKVRDELVARSLTAPHTPPAAATSQTPLVTVTSAPGPVQPG